MSDPIQNLKQCRDQVREAESNLSVAWREALAAHSDAELAAALGRSEDMIRFIRETRAGFLKAGLEP